MESRKLPGAFGSPAGRERLDGRRWAARGLAYGLNTSELDQSTHTATFLRSGSQSGRVWHLTNVCERPSHILIQQEEAVAGKNDRAILNDQGSGRERKKPSKTKNERFEEDGLLDLFQR